MTSPCTCTLACIPQGITEEQFCRESRDPVVVDWPGIVASYGRFIAAGHRDGQAWFNAVDVVHPEIARTIAGTKDDPFYNDANITGFILAVSDFQ